MNWRHGRRLAACAVLSAAIAHGGQASAAENVNPAPPSVWRAPNLRPEISTPEAGLWGLMDRAEAGLRSSSDVSTDSALGSYVKGVLCKVSLEYCGELRVYVTDRPIFNASVAPNGYVEVNSGLILRVLTEDELAYVLGHEVSHFGRNHTLNSWNARKTAANWTLALQIGVTAVAAGAMYSAASSGAPNSTDMVNSISDAARSLNNLIYLANVARFFAYSREQEAEADRLGFERATAAGYRPGAGWVIWEAVVAETRASDFPKVRKEESRASMFNTHPLTADRIATLKRLAGADFAPPPAGAEHDYRAHIRGHLGDWLKDDLRRRDFGQTLHLIGRLEAGGEDLGVLEFYRGEALRQRRGTEDGPAALRAYKAAISHPDAPPAAWRELGDAARKAGDASAARQAYQDYLLRAPEAQDRWLVEASLKTLQPAGTP